MFHDVLLVVHDVLQCLTCVSWCFTMFNKVLWCLASRATNAVAASAPADRESAAGIGDNYAEIGYNSAEIGDGAAGIVDIAANSDPMLNSVLNGDGVTLFLEEKFQRGDCIEFWSACSSFPVKTKVRYIIFFSSSFSIFYVEALDVFHVASSLNGILISIYLFKTLKNTFLKRKNK